MFKKLKDKLAEEVKSSPQRIQQFAQAAQAAVTSASSSVSDMTNNDLFTIGDADNPPNCTTKPQMPLQRKTYENSVPMDSPSPESFQAVDLIDNQRQRRLSNSSFASDVSFKLPSYESPSMYHLQSDMEVSASEAEGFSSPGGLSLDRVTKEQLYAAYRRTQDRYGKYRTQYADLARHYKLLERENSKARSVLVETQDKALRRISELREQCSLEQSAKAHLERALRMEIDEKNMKLQALTTKVNLLQNNDFAERDVAVNEITQSHQQQDQLMQQNAVENDAQLIDLSGDTDRNPNPEGTEISLLQNKIEKMETLINKYKESLKTIKEKNTQLVSDSQKLTNDLETRNKENANLKETIVKLEVANMKIIELKDINEELQNKINTYDFNKTKEMSTLEIDLQKAQETISKYQTKIDIFTKREEENAISLAENKLSIHKELESKESEIKSLKESMFICNQEIQSLNIVINDYKHNVESLEAERFKLNNEINELNSKQSTVTEMNKELQELKQKCLAFEQLKSKSDEEYKCLQLQVKQETAEKLAMIDRNTYLENRNKQLSEENTKIKSNVSTIESELQEIKRKKLEAESVLSENTNAAEEIALWKEKYQSKETEIQEERIELIKLQSEIDKLLENHDVVLQENSELRNLVSELKAKCLETQNSCSKNFTLKSKKVFDEISNLRTMAYNVASEITSFNNSNKEEKVSLNVEISKILDNLCHKNEIKVLEENLKRIEASYNDAMKQLEISLNDNNKLKQRNEEHDSLRNQFTSMQENVKRLEDEIEIKNSELEALLNKNHNVSKECEKTQSKLNHFEELIKQFQNEESKFLEEINLLRVEKKDFLEKIEKQEELNRNMQCELTGLQNQNRSLTDELALHKKNKDKLGTNEVDLVNARKHIETLEINIKDLTEENTSLKNKSDRILANVNNLEIELSDVRNLHADMEKEKDKLNQVIVKYEENEALKLEHAQLKDTETEQNINILQNQLDVTLEENYILKSKCEEVKQLKEELFAKLLLVEQKCTNYEKSLEEKDKKYETLNFKFVEIQTENELLKKDIQDLREKREEDDTIIRNVEQTCHDQMRCLEEKEKLYERETISLKSKMIDLQSETELHQQELQKIRDENDELIRKLTEKVETENEMTHKYDALKSNNDTLKEEKRSLQSEIEALQTYLAKISKDNDQLNDKLRDSISTHDDSNTEGHAEKDKIDDLLRQNLLLTEENFELKDQLHSQNLAGTEHNFAIRNESDTELALLRDKYSNSEKANDDLRVKFSEMELSTKTYNSNIQQLQDKNEKLRLSNDKLERRLDEALVSLRHLHSLQENTELEYLRNILYEYLTGSGTHSITLAKVLAAVVKFDDTQTKQVVQKEKERQGLLRQLGLL